MSRVVKPGQRLRMQSTVLMASTRAEELCGDTPLNGKRSIISLERRQSAQDWRIAAQALQALVFARQSGSPARV